jgi:hypothetical protein
MPFLDPHECPAATVDNFRDPPRCLDGASPASPNYLTFHSCYLKCNKEIITAKYILHEHYVICWYKKG